MNITKEMNIEEMVSNLMNKYGITPKFNFCINGEANSGNHRVNLVDPSKLIEQKSDDSHIPLLYWRVKRKFIELKNILDDHVVKDPCLLRSSFIGNKDSGTLKSMSYRELDIIEFITGQKIISVTAILVENHTANILLRLNNGALCSVEISLLLPTDKKVIERHEIIGRRGTASDMVVDTQIMQHSLYAFSKSREEQFTDSDFELFDLPEYKIDLIRSALKIIQEPDLINHWNHQHQHIMDLIDAIVKSNSQRKEVIL